MNNDTNEISQLLHRWADRTCLGLRDQILADHDENAVIFDVLPPLQYDGVAAYRASWDDWQPETSGDNLFELHGLQVTASDHVGFAFCQIRCGGTMPDGKKFEDNVRATFCLHKTTQGWKVSHQHISMPTSSG